MWNEQLDVLYKKDIFKYIFHISIIYFQWNYNTYYLLKVSPHQLLWGKNICTERKLIPTFIAWVAFEKLLTKRFSYEHCLMIITACLHGICFNIVGEKSEYPQYILYVNVAFRIKSLFYHLLYRLIFCNLGIL